MAGHKETKEKLNKTLIFIINLLQKNNITQWFIAYGTLLGIIRDNSCINNDDDIDIIFNKDDYHLIKRILIDNNFIIREDFNDKRIFLKTIRNDTYTSIDFYGAVIDEKGGYYDTWENVIWSKCLINNELNSIEWNDLIIPIPYNHEQKFINRYGKDWAIPRQTKGVRPKKKVI